MDEEQRAAHTTYLATTFQAAQLAVEGDGKTGAETEFDMDLDKGRTAEEHIAEFPEDAESMLAQQEDLEASYGGNGTVARAVLGHSSTDLKHKARATLNRLWGGASVFTVFHEDTHGLFRGALESGTLNLKGTVAVIRALDKRSAGRKSRASHVAPARALSFLPEGVADEDLTFKQVDEAVSEIMEAEIFRSRKQGKGARNLPQGLVSRNLSAILQSGKFYCRKIRLEFLRST